MWAIGILTTTVSEKGKVISSQVQHLLDHVHVKLQLRHGKQQSIMKLMVWMQVQYRQLNQRHAATAAGPCSSCVTNSWKGILTS